MATEAITYRTGESRGKLRTVIVEDVRKVKLITGSGVELLAAKLLHGTQCAHQMWDAALGTEGDDFVIPASQVVAKRPIRIAVKAHHKGA